MSLISLSVTCHYCRRAFSNPGAFARHQLAFPGGLCKDPVNFTRANKRLAAHPPGSPQMDAEVHQEQVTPPARAGTGAAVDPPKYVYPDSLERLRHAGTPPSSPCGAPVLPPKTVGEAEDAATATIEKILLAALSQEEFKRLFAAFKSAPDGYAFRPSERNRQALLNKHVSARSWEDINMSEKLGAESSMADQHLLIRANLEEVVQELLARHPAVLHPFEAYVGSGDAQQRVISEYFTGNIHHQTAKASAQEHGRSVPTLMLKVWSDGTRLGGNDRLGVRVVLASLGNHPLSFSKTDKGMAMLAIINVPPTAMGKDPPFALTSS